MRKTAVAAVLLACIPSIPAQAAETVTYTYDAKGRLVKVVRSGSVNNGATTDYEIDKAHNRKRAVTAGAPPP